METTDILGWASSFILLLTVGKQVHKQWSSGTSEGVSTWLFVGNLSASVGFAVYSWLLDNKVFVFTNSMMIVNGLLGLGLTIRDRRRAGKQQTPEIVK